MVDYKAIGEIIGGVAGIFLLLFGGKKWGERSNGHAPPDRRTVTEGMCVAFRKEFQIGIKNLQTGQNDYKEAAETTRKENRDDFQRLFEKLE